MKSILLLLLINCYCLGHGNAFVVHPEISKQFTFRTTALAAEDNRKRRVRRKADDSPPPQTSNTVNFQPRREDTGVSFKVTDVRDLVSGKTTTSSPSSSSVTSSASTPKAVTTATKATKDPDSSNALDDSLQQLLRDAREMQDKSTTSSSKSDDNGVTSKIRNAISTLVTVDFFVVCLFLLWFLAGIFCSVVLKDDTVQIAFNSNFQQLVQPALGILMIAAIADAVFKQKEEEEV